MIAQSELCAWLRHFPADWPRPLCMGILNVTPDSFHDGGAYLHADKAMRRLQQMVDAGADLIDIGAMSSRPGHLPVSAAEEWQRLEPVLRQAVQNCPVPLSVDTDKAEIVAAALDAGVSIINYCGGLQDMQVYRLAAVHEVPLIVMHRSGREGEHVGICDEVCAFFQNCRRSAGLAGVEDWQLIFDPGLGFGKNPEENICLMRSLSHLAGCGRPILLGYSHKRFVAAISGELPGEAPLGNCALAAYSIMQGAHIVRVHEVEQFVPIARAIRILQEGK